MWQKLSLRYKLVALVLGVSVGIGLGLLTMVMVGARRERERETMHGARSLVVAIDKALRSAMMSGNREMVRTAANSLVEIDDVTAIQVLDKSGRTVIRAGRDLESQASVTRLLGRAGQSDSMAEERAGEAYVVVAPVENEAACVTCHGGQKRLGFVSATVSTAATEQRISDMHDRLLMIGLLLVVITCIAILAAVSQWVERPLARLTRAVDGFRKRPGSTPGPKDEVARLAGSFTAMMSEIDEQKAALLRAERNLQQSQRLASIGLLAAGIAHEIGSPLSAIQLHAGFWEEQSNGPVRAAASAIQQAATRIGALQHELLTFDRREALQLARRDLVALVQRCLERPEVAALTVTYSRPEEPMPVVMDAGLLGRALGNILSNAAQAMEGEGTLSVSVQRTAPEQAEVLICDSGPGLAPEDVSFVFEPFFSRKVEGKGSGLGLAIAREIITRHGGDVVAENRPQGACFRVTLPLAPEEK